jgi:hypothetical protein
MATDTPAFVWEDSEIKYLTKISATCEDMALRHREIYIRYKRYQARFRIPAIVISAVTGMFSFGNANFPEKYRGMVNIITGISSVMIAIFNSLESYMKIGDVMSNSLLAATLFRKLKERIDCELALPVKDREMDGVAFVREVTETYDKAFNIAPIIIKKAWFIQAENEKPETEMQSDMV